MHEVNRTYKPLEPQKYRRLSKEDAAIWHEYLTTFKPKYTLIKYDLPITTQEMIDSIMDNNYEEAYKHLTNKRIDVLGYTRTHIDLFEVKPRANSHGLGQTLSYSFIYKLQFKPKVPVIPIMLCNYCTAIDKDCFAHFGVKLICMRDIKAQTKIG